MICWEHLGFSIDHPSDKLPPMNIVPTAFPSSCQAPCSWKRRVHLQRDLLGSIGSSLQAGKQVMFFRPVGHGPLKAGLSFRGLLGWCLGQGFYFRRVVWRGHFTHFAVIWGFWPMTPDDLGRQRLRGSVSTRVSRCKGRLKVGGLQRGTEAQGIAGWFSLDMGLFFFFC